MDQVKIGKYISDRRKELGMTQKQLAQQLYISEQAVSKWERGLSCPDKEFLFPLSNILEVNVADLLNGESITDSKKEIYDSIITDSVRHFSFREKRNWVKATIILSVLLMTVISSFFISAYVSETKFESTVVDEYNNLTSTLIYDGMLPAYMLYCDDPTVTNFTVLVATAENVSSSLSDLHTTVYNHNSFISDYSKEILPIIVQMDKDIYKMSSILSDYSGINDTDIILSPSQDPRGNQIEFCDYFQSLVSSYSCLGKTLQANSFSINGSSGRDEMIEWLLDSAE